MARDNAFLTPGDQAAPDPFTVDYGGTGYFGGAGVRGDTGPATLGHATRTPVDGGAARTPTLEGGSTAGASTPGEKPAGGGMGIGKWLLVAGAVLVVVALVK